MVERAAEIVLAALIMIAAGCDGGSASTPPSPPGSATPTAAPWFVDEAAQRGVDFQHESGHIDGRFLMPESVVGGVALLDMDGDGDLDLYFIQAGQFGDATSVNPPNRLYRNDGSGRFEDVTDGSGAGDRGYGCGVATGDYDGDGDLDLYVTNVGPNVLLRNDGDGRFTDVTAPTGVGDDGFGSSAAFVDFDHDGDLDLVVLNYLVWSVEAERHCTDAAGRPDYCAPAAYRSPAIDVVYRNNGDGTMTDVTKSSGLGDRPGPGLGIVCGDFNADGLVDLFVANDAYEDRLWINLGGGKFEDRAMLAGCAVDLSGGAKGGMGVDATDVDDDGDLDLIVCNLANESDSYFENRGTYFDDATARTGLGSRSRIHTRFGMAWVDFDNDGRLDLYQANGRVQRDPNTPTDGDEYAEPNLLMIGMADGTWAAAQMPGGTAEPLIATSRGAAFGDLDGDGGVDIVVANRDGPPHLLMNVVRERGHWISLHVIDERGCDALGAQVTAHIGERRVMRLVRTAYSYCAANDPRIHIGLGETDRIDLVTVRWVDGSEESFGPLDAGEVVDLTQGSGRLVP